jgi:hypothetical protein
LREEVEKFDNLTAYVERMMRIHYPDFAWSPIRESAAA